MAASLPVSDTRRQSLRHPECASCAVLSARLAQHPPGPPAEGTIVKRCSCGRAYTMPEWYALARVGLQVTMDHGGCLDLRDCACGSSISLPMRLTPAPEAMP